MEARVSVVTVTRNNASGLERTLASLNALVYRPDEVLIMDCQSVDVTQQVIDRFSPGLPVRHVNEADDGIYDAMNKGQALARSTFVHYLNAGDTVWGEPYQHLSQPTRLRTTISDQDGRPVFTDFVKLMGFGYCHQGIVLPYTHEPYNATLRVAADVEMLMGTFPSGIRALPTSETGGVTFYLGGVSSTRRLARDIEILSVFRRRKGLLICAIVGASMLIKAMIPGSARLSIARFLGKLRR
jgi:glycosyltransferase involved in cell wall biosynthesis